MLENEFFPTPSNVISQMLSFANFSAHKKGLILDPNAGSGAILDYIKDQRSNRYNSATDKLYGIELNDDLKFTLQGKGYKVLGRDFLQYDEPTTFDWIFMNPPFSNGVDHVLKAWGHLNDGGTLVALLNAQTIKNPRTKNKENLIHLLCNCVNEATENYHLEYTVDNLKKVLNVLASYERIKWLGSCFKQSERPTDVEVVMIKLTKPENKSNFTFNDFNFDLEAEVENQRFNPNALASKDIVRDLVARYNSSRKILLDRHDSQSKLDFYLHGISNPVLNSTDDNDRDCLTNNTDLNAQLLHLKSMFWNTVFIKTEIGSKATSKFRQKFREFTIQQSAIAFTEENIKEVLYLFICNRQEMMQECVIEVFDKATSYHEKNKIHNEGWKTNKSWKLNKRIIMPNGISFDGRWSTRGSFSVNHYISDFFDDLDKTMSFLSGKNIVEGGSIYSTLHSFCDDYYKNGLDYRESFESQFFRLKVFKKGTVHIDFKDMKILEQINRIVAKGKNWIGQGC